MKKLFNLLAFVITITTLAQAPQGFNYQATVRNSSGQLLLNQIVLVKFKILQNSAIGTIVYSETQTANTDDLGQINLVVGQGTATTGTFSNINWGTGSYYLGIELNSGTGYVAMGTTQLLSVPYALYANSAGNTDELQSQITTLQSQIEMLKKPQITTAPIDELTSFSAISGGTIASLGSGDISARGVVWDTSINPTITLSTKTSDGLGMGSFASAVTGLRPNIKYFLRAYATNSNGTTYGEEVSFTPQVEINNSTIPNVFIDTFSSGLNYTAFNNTDLSALQVDRDITYNNSSASIRIDVPNLGDPAGAYAGGAIVTELGRDLSSYNVLTFWAKSSKAATLGLVGFGINLFPNANSVSLENLRISTVWRKYYIPIPDASKLKSEKGLFYFSASPENGDGYSFWIDEVKFENLSNISIQQAAINDGRVTTETTYVGETINVGNLTSNFNIPNGIIQSVRTSPNYFTFSSSNVKVVTVNTQGVVTIVGPGSAVITASLGGLVTKGSITINSLGAFVFPPLPTRAPANVISVFSDSYTNINIDYFNGNWQPYQTTLSNDFEIKGDKFLNYTNFNFVGHQFANPTVNLSQMTHLHLNIYFPGAVPSNFDFLITVVDYGPNGQNGGGDDTRKQLFVPKSSNIMANEWVTIELPLNMTTKNSVGMIIYENINVTNGTALKEFYLDNIYFYK